MHRNQPYGGPSYGDRRRSASPPSRYGRPERGRGGHRGYGGRGGYSNASNSYDYNSGGYDSYSRPSQEYDGGNAYQSNYPQYDRGGPPPRHPRDGPVYGGGDYADEYQEGGRGTPDSRRKKDLKVQDSVIEERLNRERPCRTLFVRNIKYETDSSILRRQFEEHGIIRTFFDLISTRGMLFVTYFDLRAAQAARERLQGTQVAGRPIDVHYSLPRPEETEGHADREKHQGTLLISIRNSHSPIDEYELRRVLQQYGDVKGTMPVPGRSDQKFVEMYDTRATEQVYDTMRHQAFQDGLMEVEWAWDILDDPVSDIVDRGFGIRDTKMTSRGLPRGRGVARGRFSSGTGHEPDERFSSGGRGRGGYGGPTSSQNAASRGRGGGPSSFSSGPPRMDFQGPMSTSVTPAADDRLEQARQVQQLLASLKNPAESAASQHQNHAAPQQPPYPGAPSSGAFSSQQQAPPLMGLHSPVQAAQFPSWNSSPGSAPSGGVTNPYPPPVPQQSASSGLPAGVLALLQSAQGNTGAASQPTLSPPQSYYGLSQHQNAPSQIPASIFAPQSGPPATSSTPLGGQQDSMQQLLSLLAAQQQKR